MKAGDALGPYRILEKLGEGGMGEVYKARDTRLDRTVAVTVLPAHVAADPEFRQRFEREAKTLAALKHPHICDIYDVGSQNGTDYLVMEHLEGETLAQRLMKGALPLDHSLQVAIQIADALDKAHRKGIVHRDLKPGNIMLTKAGAGSAGAPQAKLLDFGLAKLRPMTTAGGVALSQAPTVSSPLGAAPGEPLTGAGTILGTFQYMAPEQLEGKDTDARTDIFAFGAVVYEMVTGKKAFEGTSQASLIGAMLHTEPTAISNLTPMSPRALDRLVTTCLAKHPDDRWQSARDMERELRWIAEGSHAPGAAAAVAAAKPSPRWQRALVPFAALVAGGAIVGAIAWRTSTPPVTPAVVRTEIASSSDSALSGQGADRDIAITPDGTTIIYRGQDTLFVRAMSQMRPTALAGLGRPRGLFVSPDGQWVGFVDAATNTLKKVAVTGGPPMTLHERSASAGGARGATWGEDGTILFATDSLDTGLQRLSPSGELSVLTRPDRDAGEEDHLWPEFLSGGQAVLFTIRAVAGGVDGHQIAVLDLRTHTQSILIRGGTHAFYVPSGHLVFAARGSLRAVPFDLGTLAVIGTPVPVIEQVGVTSSGAVEAVIAANGTLGYVTGRDGNTGGAIARSLVWVDRTGKEEPIPAPPRAYVYPRLSPDNSRIALNIRDQQEDIWVWDLARRALARLTFAPARDQRPTWTRDGRFLFFDSERGGESKIYVAPANGTGRATQLSEGMTAQLATTASADGRQIILHEDVPGRRQDLKLLTLPPAFTFAATVAAAFSSAQATGVTPGQDLRAVGELKTLIGTAFDERGAMLSPDDRWIAYESDSSGRFEIYVRPFPNVEEGQWQISTDGGVQVLWSRDGRELFYIASDDGSLMRVPVTADGSSWNAGTPTQLLSGRYFDAGRVRQSRHYDVTADGRRFLMLKETGDTEADTVSPKLIVVQNWTEELKRLVPTN